jgi:hypothetical protein
MKWRKLMGKYHLVEADGSGHINKATMKILFMRVGDAALERICQHESLETLGRKMDQLSEAHLKRLRSHAKSDELSPEPIEYEIRDGHGLRILKVKYKYYEEG